MSIKRFVAPNGREALAQIRRELGDDALVLSTRKLTGGRVEVLAVGPDAMQALIEDHGARQSTARTTGAPAIHATAKSTAAAVDVDASAGGVRTQTFEQFLQRQAHRQVQRQPAADTASATSFEPQPNGTESPSATALDDRTALPDPLSAATPSPSVFRRRTEATLAAAAPNAEPTSSVVGSPAATVDLAASASTREVPLGAAADARLLAELQSMRALLLEQMATMGTSNSAADLHRRSPMQVRAMTRLLTAGLSPDVARQIAERAPAAATPADSDQWLADVLALNVHCVEPDSDWLSHGGVFALVGPTGVGKTTTVAKLAARFAVRHGAQSLGLITLDAFRVGAHEQLRTYGRILGTPVHLAQDMATLRDLLAAMAGKRLVLIDTSGVSQRDERLAEMLEILAQAGSATRPIQRLLLLNAASHAETLDDVARAWQARSCVGAVLTKLDEAVRIGGALDCVLRHKLTVIGATNGQRVPEDWIAANARDLAETALKPGHATFVLAEAEAALLAAQAKRAGVAVAQ